MNANAGIKVDKATFYRFIERQTEGHFEYDRGRIVQHMTGGTFDHTELVSAFMFALHALLPRPEWSINSQSRGVDTAVTVRYPDVVVERAGGSRKGLFTTTPALIVEVLSPTTSELDLNVKPAEYMSLASLAAYIVASQDRPECTVWLRGADGRFPDAPLLIAGREQVIEIAALGLTIALAEVYQGIG